MRFISICFIFLLMLLVLSPKVFGQENTPQSATEEFFEEVEATLGLARMIETQDKDMPDGSIVSTSEGGAVLSSIAYDPQVLGVVARDAAIILSSSAASDGVPVISNGTVYILVSSKDGPIKKGDLITTSTTPGVGVKAVNAGYVLGNALEDYDNPDTNHVDKIAIDLDLHYFNSKPTFPGSLTDIFKLILLPTRESPTPIFKYIAAAAVVISSFVLAFVSFGRTAAKGVEALGRNPAASRTIHLGIILNVIIVIGIICVGLVVAFLILRL